jgi:hypothetical protein
MGLAAMFIMPVGGFASGLMAGLAGMGMLWFLLPALQVDVKPFKPMQWAGVMSTYFLVFLAAWVVLCNPPFNDMASPEIRNVQILWEGGYVNITESGVGEYEAIIPANVTKITVRAQVTDNVAVDTGTVIISRAEQSLVMTQTTNAILFDSDFDGVAQFQAFKIVAADTNGNVHEGFSFTIIHE